MNELHPNYGQMVNSGVPLKTAPVAAKSERLLVDHLPERSSTADKSSHQKRELLALWLFVAVSFVALGLALYGIWLKCQGRVPASPWIVP